MKKNLFFIFIVAIFTNSCEKEKIQKAVPKAKYVGCKTNYYDFLPDTSFLMPVNSYIVYSLNFNKDSLNDIYIYQENFKEYFGPHPLEAYNISLFGGDSLQFTSPHEPINENGFISKESNFSSSTDILRISTLYMTDYNPFSSKQNYIGLKKYFKGSYYYGWMRIRVGFHNNLIIFELAINTCENEPIKVGYHR